MLNITQWLRLAEDLWLDLGEMCERNRTEGSEEDTSHSRLWPSSWDCHPTLASSLSSDIASSCARSDHASKGDSPRRKVGASFAPRFCYKEASRPLNAFKSWWGAILGPSCPETKGRKRGPPGKHSWSGRGVNVAHVNPCLTSGLSVCFRRAPSLRNLHGSRMPSLWQSRLSGW